MKRARPCTVELDDDDEEDEFKPLFDYSETMGPPPTFLSDDSDDEDVIITAGPPQIRPKLSPVKEPATVSPQKDQALKVSVDDGDNDDDDYSWLNSTPVKSPNQPPSAKSPYLALTGNHALQQLRIRRMELMMLQQRASPEAMKRVEEQAIKRAGEQSRMQAQMRGETEPPSVVKTPIGSNVPTGAKSPGSEATASDQREKILMKVQNSTGSVQSIRIYMTDKFEKLFRVYSETAKVPLANLSFRFDGDQLSPTSTPKEHDMEDGELIEVYHKS